MATEVRKMATKRNIDAVHRHTSRQLRLLEQAINRLYRKASTDAASIGATYFNQYKAEWAEQLAELKRGNITMADWIQWATDTVFRGEDFVRVSDELVSLLMSTDADALALIDQIRADVFVHAHNYSAYAIERTFYDTSFTVINAQTVELLQHSKAPVLPVLAQNGKKASAWMQKRIRREITAGIMQGESIDKMAKRLRNVSSMTRAASIRSARTACTCAENAGRQMTYEEAAKQGLELRKQWLCTVDSRTRSSHASLDGETVTYNEKFSNGLRYPGDPRGSASEVYNCRCTMVTVDPEGEDGTRRVNHEAVGHCVLAYRTFDEYMRMKGGVVT